MTIYEYGNPDADTVLIQLTGDHELSVLRMRLKKSEKGLQQISDSLLQKLMTGIMSCLHGKHQRCSEMKTLVMVLSGHWSRF